VTLEDLTAAVMKMTSLLHYCVEKFADISEVLAATIVKSMSR
jgi:hypothetical protein